MHLETKTGEKKERYMVVTKVASDEELKKKEKDKQNTEIVSMSITRVILPSFFPTRKDVSAVNFFLWTV